MKYIIFYFFLLLPCLGFATPPADSIRHGYVCNAMKKIFIEPLALIDVYDGFSIRVGAEYPLSCKSSGIVTLGWYGGNGYYFKAGIKKYGYLFKDENLFIEMSVFYKNYSYTVGDNLQTNSAGVPGPEFDYNVSKNAFGTNLEIGYVTSGRRLLAEWYGGIGIRIKTVIPSISDSTQRSLYHYSESQVDPLTNTRTSNALWPSIFFGLRVGYSFSKRRMHAY